MNALARKLKALLAVSLCVLVLGGAAPAFADEAQSLSGEPASGPFETELEPWAFDAFTNEEGALTAYDEAYRVSFTGGQVTTTNGNYQKNVAANLADDTDAFWEPAGNANPSNISITVTFDEPETFQWVVYGSRKDAGLKGFPTEFELAISESASGDADWRTVTHGTGSPTSSLCAFDACPENTSLSARRVRFTFRQSKENYPSCRTLRFYKADPAEHVLDDLWDNYNHTRLKDGVTLESVQARIAAVRSNPSYRAIYKHIYEPELERVKAAAEGILETNPRLELSNQADRQPSERTTSAITRVGDVAGYARQTLKFSNNTTNRQVTGVWYPAGETARIWVERQNPDDPLPIVRWAQPYGYWASWQGNATQLVEGLNLITVPNYKTIDYKTYDIVAGCAAYLENPYTEEEQPGLVNVYFEGGRTFPVYRLGDDIEPYMAELRAQADRVRADHTSEMDVTEIVSGHVMMTVQATRADEIYGAHGHDAKQALECWDTTIHRCLAFEGIEFTPGEPHYDQRNAYLNENYRVSQVWDYGWMFTAGEHIGVYTGGDAQDVLIDPLDSYGQSKIAPNWGLIHEWGHSIDIPARTLQETTNNMPAYYESTFCPEFERNSQDIERAHQMGQPGYASGTKFNENRFNFMPFWLVESYWPGWWGRVENLYRYEPTDATNGYVNGKDQLNKTERLVLYASVAAGYDLRPWYERWGLNMDAADPRFEAETASATFKQLFAAREAAGQISKSVQGFEEPVDDLPLWYLDRAEYGAVSGVGADRDQLRIYHGDDGAPVIHHVVEATKTVVNEDKTTTEKDVVNVVLEKSSDPMHLCYLVESRAKGSGDEVAWDFAGSTHGGVFTDERPEAAGGALEYRAKALDRSLHESAYSAVKAVEPAGVVARYTVDVPAADGTGASTQTTREFESLAAAIESAERENPPVTRIEVVADCLGANIPVLGNVTLAAAGEGPITISRAGAEPILDVAGSGQLTLEGSAEHPLVFDGFFAEGAGPAILFAQNGGMLTATDVTFRNFVNAADGNAGQGGVVNVSQAKPVVSFSGCTFEDNSALDGGAVAGRATVKFTDCTFTGNTARDQGGAIRNYSGGVFTLIRCTFTGNTGVYGGALSLEGQTALLGCTITGNTGKYGGGIDASLGNRGLALDDSEGTRTLVADNTALAGDALYLANGAQTSAFAADADLSASEGEGHRAVQIASGRLVLNADLEDCVINGRNVMSGLAPSFGTDAPSSVSGVIAEMGTSTVEIEDEWMAGSPRFEVADLGRTQPVARVDDFDGVDFAEHVRLAGETGTLSLVWQGAEADDETTSVPGVYVKRGGLVTLNANGGTVNAGAVEGYVAGAETFLPTNVTKTGYSFVGWFDNEACTGTSVKAVPASASGDVSYWAKWSQGNYWINYRPNGGKLPVGYQDHRSLDETVSLVTPTREGFQFLGWYENDKFQGEALGELLAGTHEGPTTLYARWTHGRDKGKVVEETLPTCTKEGHRLVAYKCVDCDADMGAELVTLPATGHAFGQWSQAEENPCQGTKVRSRVCKTCGYVEYEGLETGAESHHSWGDWETVPGKAATCTADGLEQRSCSACDVVEERVVPALGHEFANAVEAADDGEGEDENLRVVPATCVDDGVIEHLDTCVRCHEKQVRSTETITAPGHNWGAWTVFHDGDCATQASGLRRRVCETCGETIDEVLPFEHAWEAEPRVDEPASCTHEGSQSIHCERCGATKDVTTLATLPHDYVDGVCRLCGVTAPATGGSAGGQPGTGDSTTTEPSDDTPTGDGRTGDTPTDDTTDDATTGDTPETGTGGEAPEAGAQPTTSTDAPSSEGPSGAAGAETPDDLGATSDGSGRAAGATASRASGARGTTGPNADDVPLADGPEICDPNAEPRILATPTTPEPASVSEPASAGARTESAGVKATAAVLAGVSAASLAGAVALVIKLRGRAA